MATTTAVDLVVGHTADVPPHLLAGARALLEVVFDGDFEDDDWEHGLGGVHALAVAGTGAGAEVVGHASVVQRRLLHGGRALRAGYVEGVGVHPDRQGQGLGGRLMARIERVVQAAYDLGALGASDAGMPLYTGRGWVVWRGPLAVLSPDGVVPTPDDDGSVLVLPTPGVPLDTAGSLTCDWRAGDVW